LTAASYKIIGRGSDEGDHRYQPLDRVIVLALVLAAKTCAFSSDTQNSNVTVSYPKPRKNADVGGGTSLRFVSKIHRCRRFGRLALTDRSVGHGRHRRSVRLYLRDDTVDIDGRFGYTYGELRSISTVGSVTLTENYGRYRRSVRFIVPRNRSISTISVG